MPSLDIIIPAFNVERSLGRTLDAIFKQRIPAGLLLRVVVANNNSTDGTSDLIEQWIAKEGITAVDNFSVQGRSATINAGVAASEADYILVIDADCVLVGESCISLVAAAMEQNIGAGFGYATGSPDTFFGRYHRSLVAQRVNKGWRGWTTPCCLVQRKVFNAVGGFSTEYQHYGFEDRDFICRLRSFQSAGVLQSLPDLQVIHGDDTTAREVFEKMYVSGRHSSEIFRRNFPDEYLATAYARVDVDVASRTMSLLLRSMSPLRPLFAGMASFLSQRRRTPLAIGRPFIKLCSALNYFRGTVDRTRLKS